MLVKVFVDTINFTRDGCELP